MNIHCMIKRAPPHTISTLKQTTQGSWNSYFQYTHLCSSLQLHVKLGLPARYPKIGKSLIHVKKYHVIINLITI